MDTVDQVTNALRDSLDAFMQLDQASAARVVVALYSVPQSKRLALAEEIARHVQPASKGGNERTTHSTTLQELRRVDAK